VHLRLLAGQVLEHRGQRANELEQALLKVLVALALCAHELRERALALPQLAQAKGAQLVQPPVRVPHPLRRTLCHSPRMTAHMHMFVRCTSCLSAPRHARCLLHDPPTQFMGMHAAEQGAYMTAGMDGKTRHASS